MNKRIIYMDNAATTKPYDEVLTAMNECYMHNYFNPSSIY
jgi:cysteine sulfinate desulfinase/cysteine desulfurase-like protein